MQNKPNFQVAQMNVSIFYTTDYENISDWTLVENKPNSNPILPPILKISFLNFVKLYKILTTYEISF